MRERNNKVSIIVPSRGDNSGGEKFLSQTIDDLFTKAHEDVEVIAVLDGYWPNPQLKERDNLIIIHRGSPQGLRAANNAGSAVANGKWLMKCDAHCMFAEGYDEILKADCDDNWVVIPPRYSLDAENWAIENNGKPRRDYHYLCYPNPDKEDGDNGMHGKEWWERGKERSDPQYDIDDNMSFQGSAWFMAKKHFDNFLHGMDEAGYGTFSQEPQEIGNKTWLGGGRLIVNKKTWYAHLHKGNRYGRMYKTSHEERQAITYAHNWSAHYWMTNQWKDRIHDIDWLIDKFWPIPGWPENWRERDYSTAYHF